MSPGHQVTKRWTVPTQVTKEPVVDSDAIVAATGGSFRRSTSFRSGSCNSVATDLDGPSMRKLDWQRRVLKHLPTSFKVISETPIGTVHQHTLDMLEQVCPKDAAIVGKGTDDNSQHIVIAEPIMRASQGEVRSY